MSPSWRRRGATSRDASPGDLPQDESEAVHVGHDVGLEVVPVQALVQHLRGHVAFGAHPRVRRDVHLVRVAVGMETEKKGGTHSLLSTEENATKSLLGFYCLLFVSFFLLSYIFTIHISSDHRCKNTLIIFKLKNEYKGNRTDTEQSILHYACIVKHVFLVNLSSKAGVPNCVL